VNVGELGAVDQSLRPTMRFLGQSVMRVGIDLQPDFGRLTLVFTGFLAASPRQTRVDAAAGLVPTHLGGILQPAEQRCIDQLAVQ